MSGVWIFQLFSVVLILICPCIGTFTCRHCVFCLPKADPTEINYAGEVFGYHIHRCPVSGEPEYFLLSQILFLYPDKLDTLDLSPIPCYKECRSCVQIIQKSCTSVKPLAGVYWKELYQGLFHQTATNATPATSSQSSPPTAANQSDSTLAKPSSMCGNNITVIINNVSSHSNNNTVVIDNSNCGHSGDTGGNVVITNTNSDNNVNMLTIKRNSNNETCDKATIPVIPSGSSEDPLADIIVQHHQGQVDKPATPTGSSDDQPVHVKKHQEAQFSSSFARSKRSANMCCDTTVHSLPYTDNLTIGDTPWYAVRFYNPCADLPYNYQMCEHAYCGSNCISANTQRSILMTTNEPSETYGHFFTIFSSFFMANVRFYQIPLPGYCICLN